METEIQVVESFEKNAPRNQQLAITPDQMLLTAIQKGADLSQIEKLMDLKDRWDKKNAERAYRDAIANFTKEKPELTKTAEVGFGNTKYKYIPLARIQKAVDPILGKFGLSYRWEQEEKEGKVKISCIVSHVDGHSESTWLQADADNSGGKNKIQATGSTNSYLQRYTLCAILGLSADVDNDGKDGQKEDKRLAITDANWPSFVGKVKDGTIQMDELQASFRLKDSQIAELKKLTK